MTNKRQYKCFRSEKIINKRHYLLPMLIVFMLVGAGLPIIQTNALPPASEPSPNNLSTQVNQYFYIYEDGTAHICMVMGIYSEKMVESYKEAFGIDPDITNTEIDVPETANRTMTLEGDDGNVSFETWVEPVKERLFEGIYEELKSLYGFEITSFTKATIIIGENSDTLKIYVEADGIPDIAHITVLGSKTRYQIISPPFDISYEFILYQMQVQNLMMQLIPGNQIFTKSWDTKIILPQDATLNNPDTFEGTPNHFNLAEGKSFDSKVSRDGNIIRIEENCVFTEGLAVPPSDQRIDRSFTIDYTLPIICEREIPSIHYTDVKDSRASWDIDWDLSWKPVDVHDKDIGGGCILNAEVNFGFDVDGIARIDWNQCYMEATLTATAYAWVKLSKEYHKIFTIYDGSFLGKTYYWKGTQLALVTPHLDLNISVEVNVDASVEITIEKTEVYELKAGARLEFVWAWPPVKFHRIWSFENTQSTFDYTYTGDLEVMVKPRFGVGISILLASLVGPRIEPGIYLQADFAFHMYNGDMEIYWMAKIGFDLYVGVAFFGGIYNWMWPNPIVDIVLWEWDSRDGEPPGGANPGSPNPPIDGIPPITTLTPLPAVNNWTGNYTTYYFSVNDPGAEATGNCTTQFQVYRPDDGKWWPGPDSGWVWYFTYTNATLPIFYIITPMDPYNPRLFEDWYEVTYRSRDNATDPNYENWTTDLIDIDVWPPEAAGEIGYPVSEVMHGGQTYYITGDTEITLDVIPCEYELGGQTYLQEDPGCNEWYAMYNILGDSIPNGSTGWFNGSKNTPETFTFSDPDGPNINSQGEYTLRWSARDALENWWPYADTTFILDETGAEAGITIGYPQYQGGLYVTTHTPITITGSDPAGVSEIHYRINGGAEHIIDDYTATFSFTEECTHVLEFWAVDVLGNEGDHSTQTFYVDDTPPTTTLEYGTPYYTDGTDEYITSDTLIYLNTNDGGLCQCGVKEIWYNYGEGWNVVPVLRESITFTIPDECTHTIDWYAVDNLGNTESTHSTIVKVDNTPPTVPSKEIGEPQYQGGYYVSSGTPFTLTANDPGLCASGIKEIHYIIDEDDYIFSGNPVIFNLTGYGEGEHTLTFSAVDNLGHTSTTHTQTHIVDDYPPITYKIFTGPTCGNVPPVPGWQVLKTYELMGTYPETWYNDVIDLSSYAGSNITLAWRYYSDDEYLGAIDDIVILEDGSPIYSENFDSYTDDGYYTPGPFPPGWTEENYGTSCSSPTYYRHWGAESYKRHSLPNSMACYYNCPNDDWIITPEFTLSDGSSYALDYWYFHDDSWDIYLDLYIMVDYEVPEVEGPVWVTSDTEICFYSFDNITGTETLYIEVWWDSDNNGTVDTITDQRFIKDNYPNDANPEVGEISYCLTLPEECTHEIFYYATDYFGWIEDVHREIDHVDNTPPIVNKTFDGPGTLDYLFVNMETMITLEAMDLPEPYGNGTGGGGGGGGGGEYIYFNDFETDEDGWTVDTAVGDWEWTNTYDVSLFVPGGYTCEPPDVAYSGTGLWGTVMYGPYSNSGSETTMSQTFDFTGYSNVYLSFASWSDLFGSWDYGQVFVNGVEVFYVDTYHPGCAWTEENISLSAYDGMSSVEIVFSVHASTVVNYAGWYIDDVRIGGTSYVTREMIEDFEQGPPWPWSPWTSALLLGSGDIYDDPGASLAGTISTTAAHDGTYGIIDPSWYYRTDVAIGNPGDKLSCWGRFTGSGRIYFGFAASGSGCYSFVGAPNTGNIIIQQNSGYGYSNLVEVPHTWEYNKWYRMEVVFDSTTDVTCNLYDSDGTTLLNTASYSGISGLPGGIAMRSFGTQHIDTIEKPGADGPDLPEGCASGTVLIEYRIWTEDGGWGNWTTYWDAYNSSAGTGPFNFTEGCMHYLQYRAVDCLGNTLLCEDDLMERATERDLLLEEGFEGTLFPPSGWDQTIYNSAATFERYTGLSKERGDSRDGFKGLLDPKEPQGSYCACVWWDYYEQDEWLFTTAPVDLSGYTDAELKFYTYNYDSISWVEHDYVKISIDGGSSWTTLGDMAWDYPNHFWGAEIVYDLGDYLGESVVVGFHRVTPDGGSGAWGIDHVRIEATSGGGNGDDDGEELPITVYNQTHYVDLEPPVSWIELELDHDGNVITPYTEFMIWQEDFACNQTGGSQCCTIHFRIDGPPGSMFYWNGQYLAADGSWKRGGTGLDEPVAFQIRDSTGYIKSGKYVIEYWAEDCLGNVEPVIHRHTYFPDKTAPTTTLLFSGPLYHDGYDWISEDTTINLVSDDHQGSGVLAITYQIDDGPELTYSGPFSISGDGIHTITYSAVDMVNHREPAQTATVMVDGSGPDASVSFTGETYTTSSVTWVTQDTTLGVTGSDDGVGLETLYYRSNDGAWQAYQGSFTFGEGSYVVECYGVDKLGNSGPVGQVAVGVDTSAPSVTYESPQSSHLYIAGREIMVLPSGMDVDAVVIGPTSISASAVDGGVGVERVELFIDGELRYTSHTGSLEFVWNQRTFLRHTVEVVTVDFFGYSSSKILDLWVFNI